METTRKLGVIADDFTGASDAASFLLKGGSRVIMCNEIPKEFNEDFDALVIALKIRSVSPEEAKEQVEKAVNFLVKMGCSFFYYKYCSTFDSTPKGNIGIVMDFLVEMLHVPYSVLCPSLPVNGRIVENGCLYVNGIPLDQSPMKDHPLNPMWDSFIPSLMKPQSKYACEVLRYNQMDAKNLAKLENKHKGAPFYIIPDYKSNTDGRNIASLFNHLTLLSGGSGLLEYLATNSQKGIVYHENLSVKKPIILCGSCSKATKEQIQFFKENGGCTISIDSNELLEEVFNSKSIFENVQKQNKPVLIYSNAIEQDMNQLKMNPNFYQASKAMENFMSELSALAYKSGFDRIVVAGGETSGAVIKALGFKSFYIEKNIDPGVPVLRPLDSPKNTVILKSGNFGSRDFFIKAIQ